MRAELFGCALQRTRTIRADTGWEKPVYYFSKCVRGEYVASKASDERKESEPAAGGATSTPQAATTKGVRTRGGARAHNAPAD